MGEHLECFYHGWTYDGAGQCVLQPAEPPGGEGRSKIEGWPVREYLGLIFAYLGEGEPPPMPYFEAYHRDGFTQVRESRRPWSYFDQLENSVDEVHFNFVHRKSKFADVGLTAEIPELSCEETEYGILRMGRRGNRVRKSHILMPNCMYSMVFEHFKGWAEHLSWRVPIDRHTHVSFMIECIHKEGAEAEEFSEAAGATARGPQEAGACGVCDCTHSGGRVAHRRPRMASGHCRDSGRRRDGRARSDSRSRHGSIAQFRPSGRHAPAHLAARTRSYRRRSAN